MLLNCYLNQFSFWAKTQSSPMTTFIITFSFLCTKKSASRLFAVKRLSVIQYFFFRSCTVKRVQQTNPAHSGSFASSETPSAPLPSSSLPVHWQYSRGIRQMQAISTRCLINTNKKKVTGKTTKTCYFLFVEPLKRKENMFFELRIQKKQDSNPVSRIYQRFAHVKFFFAKFSIFSCFSPEGIFFRPFFVPKHIRNLCTRCSFVLY